MIINIIIIDTENSLRRTKVWPFTIFVSFCNQSTLIVTPVRCTRIYTIMFLSSCSDERPTATIIVVVSTFRGNFQTRQQTVFTMRHLIENV